MEIKEGNATLDQKRKAYGQGLIDLFFNQLKSYNLYFKEDDWNFTNDVYVVYEVFQNIRWTKLSIGISFWLRGDEVEPGDQEVFKNFVKDYVETYLKNTPYPIEGKSVIPSHGDKPWLDGGIKDLSQSFTKFDEDFDHRVWFVITLWEVEDEN